MAKKNTESKSGGSSTLTYTKVTQKIAKGLGVSTSLVSKVVAQLGEEICAGLKKTGHFRFGSLGSFNVKTLPPRSAFNPRNREPIQVGERKKIRFKAGTKMVASVCGEYESKSVSPASKTSKKAAAKKATKTAGKGKPKSESTETEDFDI